MATEYRIDFDEIKRTVPMDQVVGFLGISGLKAKGTRQWKGDVPVLQRPRLFRRQQ